MATGSTNTGQYAGTGPTATLADHGTGDPEHADSRETNANPG